MSKLYILRGVPGSGKSTYGKKIVDSAPNVRLSEKDGQYTVSAHNYDIENMDRYTGKDPQPVDPLWLAYKGYSMPEFTDMEFYEYLKSMYINIWPDEYLKVLGWDREHPEVKGPYDTIQKGCDPR